MPTTTRGDRTAPEYRRLPRTVEDHLLDTMTRVDGLELDFQDLRERLAVFERVKELFLMLLRHGAEIMKSVVTIASIAVAFTGHLPVTQAADLLRKIAELWGG